MMKRAKKNSAWRGTDFETRVLIYLFAISTVINGAISNGAHSHSMEMEISPGKRLENSGKIFKMDPHINGNKTIYNRNILLSTSFDKMLHWIFDNEIDKELFIPVVCYVQIWFPLITFTDATNQFTLFEVGRSCIGRSLKFKFGERFAFRKRLQFALLPIMYKMGVMTTLLTGLTILVLKGLTIGVILLIFAFGNYFTKLHKHSYQSAQPIHVHVHSQDGHKVTSFPSAVGPWDRVASEMHPGVFLSDDSFESYQQSFIQNPPAMVKFKPLL